MRFRSQPSTGIIIQKSSKNLYLRYETKAIQAMRSQRPVSPQQAKTLLNVNTNAEIPSSTISAFVNKIYSFKKEKEIDEQKQIATYYETDSEQNYRLSDQQYQTDIEVEPQNTNGQLYSPQVTTCNPSKNYKTFWTKTPHLKQKLQTFFEEYIHADQQNGPKSKSLRQFSRQFNIPYSSLNRLYSKWRRDPTLLILGEDKQMKEKKIAITANRTQRILSILKRNPYCTANEIQDELIKHEDCLRRGSNGLYVRHVNTKFIYRILHEHNYVFKRIQQVPVARNTQQNIMNRSLYCQKIQDILADQHHKVFYLDSTYVNLYMRREKAWSKKDEPATDQHTTGPNIELLALIGKQGVVRCELIVGSINKRIFFNVLQKLFNPIFSVIRGRRQFLIVDGAFLRAKPDIIEFARHGNFEVIVLPPYTPQLNPTELFFHEFKSLLRKYQFQTEQQLLRATKQVFQNFKCKRSDVYYNHIEKYLLRGIKKEPF